MLQLKKAVPQTVALSSEILRGDPKKHIVFLHGLFGRAKSLRFLAAAPEIQQNFTCHLPDMRNHGHENNWHDEMTYSAMATDVKEYLDV